MVIAVNTRLLLKNRLEGIGWFMHENLKRITNSHPEHRFVFLFDRPYSREFVYGDNVLPLIVAPPARHPFLWYFWFQYSLPPVLKKHRAELFISPDGYVPLDLRIPVHTTIHDINFHHRPGDLPRISRAYYRKYFPRFAVRSDRIATVSEYSKNDLVSSYGIPPEKIDVVYNGVNELYSPLSLEEAERERQALTGGVPFFVFVGSMHPRKNLPNLLRAFDIFRTSYGKPYKLVIVGYRMFMTGEIDKVYREMKHREDVLFPGRLSPEELRGVMGASAGMTFVPLFEGFGIPLLEAMRCGVPILASNVTSIPEIADAAAFYADPLDIGQIARGMEQLASDSSLRSRLVEAGRERARDFSWERTSVLYWNSISRLI